MDCGDSNIELGWGGGGEGWQGGRGDDKQRPKDTKVINVPMSIIETHFLLLCLLGNLPKKI